MKLISGNDDGLIDIAKNGERGVDGRLYLF